MEDVGEGGTDTRFTQSIHSSHHSIHHIIRHIHITRHIIHHTMEVHTAINNQYIYLKKLETTKS
ncbi:hypothetical protein [Lysinibacillus sp. fls2-241-R2A-57]|nr:hypothetical protein [Lysinibacillus sp. fls2-241-R2A-57]